MFKKEILNDSILKLVKEYTETQWPNMVKGELKYYSKIKDNIFVSQDLLFFNQKIIVPSKLRKDMLKLLHDSCHFGIVKTKLRAREIFYWPKINDDIENYVENCEICQEHKNKNTKEPLLNYEIPDRPWQILGSDILEYNHNYFILLVDYYSNWIVVEKIKDKSAEEVKKFFENTFCHYGFPEKIVVDNNPYNSHVIKKYAQDVDFKLVYISPYHHQSNGLAEKAVNIVKNCLKKNNINRLKYVLLEYNNTILPAVGYSPAQLLINRIQKTKLPISSKLLESKNIDSNVIRSKLENKQIKQKHYFDKNSRKLCDLDVRDDVMIQSPISGHWNQGIVLKKLGNREYEVKDKFGKIYRRNRIFLNKIKEKKFSYKNDLLYDDLEELILRNSLNNNNVIVSHATKENVIDSSVRPKRLVQVPKYLADYHL